MSRDFLELENKIVLITGATSGIGKTTALAFAAQGARLILTGRNEAAGKRVVEEVKAKGVEAHFIQSDASDEKQVEATIQEALEYFGGIDITMPDFQVNWLHWPTRPPKTSMQYLI